MSKRVKNSFLDLLGLGTKTTIYHVSSARKGKGRNSVSKSSWKHKGYTIYKREDGEFEVPRMDRDSRFDSIFDAKRFIDANTGKGMVSNPMAKTIKVYELVDSSGKTIKVSRTKAPLVKLQKRIGGFIRDSKYSNNRNPSLTSFIPIKGIRKNADGSISLLVDSAKKVIKPITGMLRGVGKVIGNPSSGRARLIKLINVYNRASDPSVARTDTAHKTNSKRAKAALAQIHKRYIEGVDYKELSNGALWPKS